MNWAEFFSMGGRGFYVWGSYGAFALAIVTEIILLRARIRRTAMQNKEGRQ
ncbi:MAG: heme exporter protein CcmD [Betaproteobacteria bacterium]